MKQGIYIFLAAILLSLSATSCEHDFELDVPRSTKNVVLANFKPNDVMKVYVSSTVPVGSVDSMSLYTSNAKIALSANGEFVENLTFEEGKHGDLPYYFSDRNVESGVLYQIDVEVKGKPISSSSNQVPNDPAKVNTQLISLEEKLDVDFPEITNVTARVRLDFSNDLDDAIYYHVIGSSYGDFLTNLTVVNNIDHLDILHEEGTLIRLSNFDAASKYVDLEVEFFYYQDIELREPFKLELRKCSKDYYLFHRSVGEQEISNYREGILSSQSIQIHNNIMDGVGNFSSYTSHEILVTW